MRVAVSVDMEGASQLRSVREIWGCLPDYWQTGRPRLEQDVRAACQGLLAGGATELIVLDNHGGNTVNVTPQALPKGARLETWRDFELREHGVDATFQVGYHARGGVDGFLSHTYLPGLRLRVDGELISESHGRAWAAQVPLLGITGNDSHRETLGSLANTRFLVLQRTLNRSQAEPVYTEADGLDAIHEFATQCARDATSAPPLTAPSQLTLEASMPNGNTVTEQMKSAGWTPTAQVEFSAQLHSWNDARELLAAAMNAALEPFTPYWLGGFDNPNHAATADQHRVNQLRLIFDAWAKESHPQWYTQPTDPLPAGIRERLAQHRS